MNLKICLRVLRLRKAFPNRCCFLFSENNLKGRIEVELSELKSKTYFELLKELKYVSSKPEKRTKEAILKLIEKNMDEYILKKSKPEKSSKKKESKNEKEEEDISIVEILGKHQLNIDSFTTKFETRRRKISEEIDSCKLGFIKDKIFLKTHDFKYPQQKLRESKNLDVPFLRKDFDKLINSNNIIKKRISLNNLSHYSKSELEDFLTDYLYVSQESSYYFSPKILELMSYDVEHIKMNQIIELLNDFSDDLKVDFYINLIRQNPFLITFIDPILTIITKNPRYFITLESIENCLKFIQISQKYLDIDHIYHFISFNDITLDPFLEAILVNISNICSQNESLLKIDQVSKCVDLAMKIYEEKKNEIPNSASSKIINIANIISLRFYNYSLFPLENQKLYFSKDFEEIKFTELISALRVMSQSNSIELPNLHKFLFSKLIEKGIRYESKENLFKFIDAINFGKILISKEISEEITLNSNLVNLKIDEIYKIIKIFNSSHNSLGPLAETIESSIYIYSEINLTKIDEISKVMIIGHLYDYLIVNHAITRREIDISKKYSRLLKRLEYSMSSDILNYKFDELLYAFTIFNKNLKYPYFLLQELIIQYNNSIISNINSTLFKKTTMLLLSVFKPKFINHYVKPEIQKQDIDLMDISDKIVIILLLFSEDFWNSKINILNLLSIEILSNKDFISIIEARSEYMENYNRITKNISQKLEDFLNQYKGKTHEFHLVFSKFLIFNRDKINQDIFYDYLGNSINDFFKMGNSESLNKNIDLLFNLSKIANYIKVERKKVEILELLKKIFNQFIKPQIKQLNKYSVTKIDFDSSVSQIFNKNLKINSIKGLELILPILSNLNMSIKPFYEQLIRNIFFCLRDSDIEQIIENLKVLKKEELLSKEFLLSQVNNLSRLFKIDTKINEIYLDPKYDDKFLLNVVKIFIQGFNRSEPLFKDICEITDLYNIQSDKMIYLSIIIAKVFKMLNSFEVIQCLKILNFKEVNFSSLLNMELKEFQRNLPKLENYLFINFVYYLPKNLVKKNLIDNFLQRNIFQEICLSELCGIFRKFSLTSSIVLSKLTTIGSQISNEDMYIILKYLSENLALKLNDIHFEFLEKMNLMNRDINFSLYLALIILIQEKLFKFDTLNSKFKALVFENLKTTKFFHQQKSKVFIENKPLIINYKESFTLEEDKFKPNFQFQETILKAKNLDYKVPVSDITAYTEFIDNSKYYLDYKFYLVYLLNKDQFTEADGDILQERVTEYQINDFNIRRKNKIMIHFVIDLTNYLENNFKNYELEYKFPKSGLLVDLIFPNRKIGFMFLNEKDLVRDFQANTISLNNIKNLEIKCIEEIENLSIKTISIDEWTSLSEGNQRKNFFQNIFGFKEISN